MNSETKFAEIYKDIEYFLYENGYAVVTQTIQKVFELGKIDSINIMETLYHEQSSKLEGIFIIGEEQSPNEINISLQREDDLNQMLFEQKKIIEASIFALVPRSENNSLLKIMNDQFMKLFQKKQKPITCLSQQKKRQWVEEEFNINFSSLQNPLIFEEHKQQQLDSMPIIKEQSTGQKKYPNINSKKKFNFDDE